MAHYAFLDSNNIVTEVITGIDEDDKSTLPSKYSSWEEFYLSMRPQYVACKRTSYNMYGNEHKKGGTKFRGNYAGIGFTYDPDKDVFIEPQPYNSWTLDESKWQWKAPKDKPDDGKDYIWNENKGEWEEIVYE